MSRDGIAVKVVVTTNDGFGFHTHTFGPFEVEDEPSSFDEFITNLRKTLNNHSLKDSNGTPTKPEADVRL